jgi:hypothetical protein
VHSRELGLDLSSGAKEFITNMDRAEITSGKVTLRNGFEGEAKATPHSSQAELEAKGIIGIYKRVGDNTFGILRPSI